MRFFRTTGLLAFAAILAPAFADASSPCSNTEFGSIRGHLLTIRFQYRPAPNQGPIEIITDISGHNYWVSEGDPTTFGGTAVTNVDSGNLDDDLTGYINSLCGPDFIANGEDLVKNLTVSLPRAGAQSAVPVSASGQSSQPLAFADLNGDGIPDTVQVDASAGGLVVQLMAAGGSVLSTNTINPGFVPLRATDSAVVIADFNGDGKPDLAVSYYGDAATGAGGAVFVLLGNGDGTFGAPQSFTAGSTPVPLAVADFNGDGKLDIAAANVTSRTISVLLGNGDGTFGTPTAYPTGEGQNGAPSSIIAVDLNGDGVADLAVGGGLDNSVSVLLNSGGKFGPAIVTSIPVDAQSLAYSDFNHDGNLDLVIASEHSSATVMLFGKGNGTFQPAAAYAVGTNPASIGVLPFPSGNTALVLADQVSIDDLIIIISPQGEVPAPEYNFVGISSLSGLTAVAAVDLNGDGQPDVVTAESYSSTPVAVMISQGAQFNAPVKYPLAPNPLCSPCAGPAALAIGDFNGDGKPDVIVGNAGFPNNNTAGLVNVLLGNGNGTLKAAIATPLPSGSPVGQYSTQLFALGDFNQDGKLDAAVAAYGTAPNGSGAGGVILLMGKGDGTFQTPVTLAVPGGLHPVAVAAADLNADGILDLVVALVDKAFSRNPETLAVFLGQGKGTFGVARTFALQSEAGAAGAIAISDFNGDGKLDIAVSSNYAGSALIDILLGDGAGGFQEVANLPTTNSYAPIPMVTADLNGDRKADLVVGGPEGSFFLGNGDGTFQPVQYFSSGSVAGMALTKFIGSNGPDLVIANPAGTWVSLFNGFSASTLSITSNVSAATSTVTTLAPASIATAFGSNLATGTAAASTSTLPTSLSQTTVTITDSTGKQQAAPLFYVSPTQVNYEVPGSIATGAGQVMISAGNGLQGTAAVQIANIAPGIFELDSAGLVAAEVLVVAPDGSQSFQNVYQLGSSNQILPLPIDLSAGQVYLEIYGTGIRNAKTVSAAVGGHGVPVLSSGPQGVYVGLDQINIGPLPVSLEGLGQTNIVLTANGQAANAVNITFK
jgi:uncharacterized protein (TIGR03437 family)